MTPKQQIKKMHNMIVVTSLHSLIIIIMMIVATCYTLSDERYFISVVFVLVTSVGIVDLYSGLKSITKKYLLLKTQIEQMTNPKGTTKKYM